jgi:hypothetical protein
MSNSVPPSRCLTGVQNRRHVRIARFSSTWITSGLQALASGKALASSVRNRPPPVFRFWMKQSNSVGASQPRIRTETSRLCVCDEEGTLRADFTWIGASVLVRFVRRFCRLPVPWIATFIERSYEGAVSRRSISGLGNRGITNRTNAVVPAFSQTSLRKLT